MRLVKFQLADSQFWFFSDISLTQKNKTSNFVDIDLFTDHEKQIIDKSLNKLEIKLFDFDGNAVRTIKEIGYINGELNVNTDDTEEDEYALMPEIVSVTVDSDDIDNKEEELSFDPTPEDLENAKILLSKNGNTVKKTLKEDNVSLLMLKACFTIEQENKNRSSVMDILNKRIMEFSHA